MIFEPIVHSFNSIINKSITHLFDAKENISSKVKVAELSKILPVPDIEVFLFQPRNNLPMKTMSTIFYTKRTKNYFQKSLRYKVNFPVNTKPLKLTKACILVD